MEKSQQQPKVTFICKACGKTLSIQQNIYEWHYKDFATCLSCRKEEDMNGVHRPNH